MTQNEVLQDSLAPYFNSIGTSAHTSYGYGAYQHEPQQSSTDRAHDDSIQPNTSFQAFIARNAHHSVTMALIAVSCIVYLIEVVLSGFSLEISGRVLVAMGAMFPAAMSSPLDCYRFITPIFLHLDLAHLAFNMVALYSVGVLLEQVLGKRNLLLLYGIAGITGNVGAYYASLMFEGGMSISAGASTSIFGLFVATALLSVLYKNGRQMFAAYSKGMWAVIVANMAYTLLIPGISISGHLAGAIGGAIGMLMLPCSSLRTSRSIRVVMWIVWLTSVCFLIGII